MYEKLLIISHLEKYKPKDNKMPLQMPLKWLKWHFQPDNTKCWPDDECGRQTSKMASYSLHLMVFMS